MGGLSQCCLARCSSVLRSRRSSEYIKATIGKKDQLTTQIGPEEPNPESSDYEIPATRRKKSRFFIKTFLVAFSLKLNFAHQTTSCTCSQGALFITLQLQTYCTDKRHTVRKCTMSFCTVSTCRVQVGPLQECVRCLNDRVVQGGAQETTMYLQLHCRKKTKRQWKP